MVTDTTPHISPWRWAMLPLWVIFFIMGLFPEMVFIRLRIFSGVVTQSALVNSPLVLYMALVAFLVWFLYARCRESGMGPALARSRSFSAGVYALAAFLPVRLELAFDYGNILIPEYRNMLLITLAVKLISWTFLFVLILRYHFWHGPAALDSLPSLLPSVRNEPRADQPPEDETHAPDHSQGEGRE